MSRHPTDGTPCWSTEQALARAHATGAELEGLVAEARARRDATRGATITWSPKVFLPVTNLCRNVCDYCTFRKSPGWNGAWTMSPDEIRETLDQGRDAGCSEALLCLGDTPETVFKPYARQLAEWGFGSTVDYLVWVAQQALERGLLPHTNAGVLTADQLAQLRPVNASMGLMLESVSERLCAKGGPHHRAPDKQPAVRLQVHADAGRQRIPWTSGVLVGIGETPEERVETLAAIAASHAEHGHIQEVIIQPFRPKAGIPMAQAAPASGEDLVRAIALARLMLPDDVSVQTPPNLSAQDDALKAALDAGADDLGGISPLTPDYINPGHRWPHTLRLAETLQTWGYQLQERLPVHDRFVRDGWLAPTMLAHIQARTAA